MKDQSFFQIYLQYLINYIISIACIIYANIKMAETNDSIAYAYAISSKTQKLSVQPTYTVVPRITMSSINDPPSIGSHCFY
jgi:hypothetical protein